MKIWDVNSGQCLHTLVRYLLYSRPSLLIVMESCISLRFESQHGHDDWVHAIVFHPNGQYMLTAADDHTIRIWDLKTGRCTRKIEAHVQFVTSMSWGRQVVGTAPQGTDKTDPNAGPRLVNVIATTGSDQVCLSVAIAESQRISTDL